jgi:hypothetical protein
MNAAVLTLREAVTATARRKSISTTEHRFPSVDPPISRPALICRWYRDGGGRLICRWQLVPSDADCRSAAMRSAPQVSRRGF